MSAKTSHSICELCAFARHSLPPIVFNRDHYCLLDFGEGRKLERFGPVVLDRPSPAAGDSLKANPQQWETATARFTAAGNATAGCGQRGRWELRTAVPDRWTIEHAALAFELRPTEFGHIGVFPEQAENWDWIARQVARFGTKLAGNPRPRVLNLFAYTGGSTLAAAAAGAEVVHIDASKSTVGWARRNAELSELTDAPIRWIVEDARHWVARELKRGNRYDGIILDPPTYGHGKKGVAWQLDRDLPALLAACGALLAEAGFVLLTCHSRGWGSNELRRALQQALPPMHAPAEARNLTILCNDGRPLHSGVAARSSGF